jgi:hypothetical protein
MFVSNMPARFDMTTLLKLDLWICVRGTTILQQIANLYSFRLLENENLRCIHTPEKYAQGRAHLISV